MERAKKDQGQKTRERLIDVTTRLFRAKGYAGTSLDHVAKEAKTSKSSIFWHFENKEHLLFAVVDKAMAEWEARAGREILSEQDPPAQLSKLIRLYAGLAADRPDTLRLLLGLLLETAEVNDKVRARFQKMYEGYRTSIEMVIEEGIAGRHFSPTLSPQELATLILAWFDGLFVQRILNPDDAAIVSAEALRASVFRLLGATNMP